MQWDKIKIFHAVAQAGNFSNAAKELGLNQSSISRHIQDLEDSLSTQLFSRHSRGLTLTEAGEMLYSTTKDVNAKLTRAQQKILDSKRTASGPLVITTTTFFGGTWLAENVSQFIQDNKDVQLILELNNNVLDLSMREADIAIRMQRPHQQDIIQRHLITFHFHLYASKDYIAKHGDIKKPEDLQNHHLICISEHSEEPFFNENWILKFGNINPLTQERLTTASNLYSIYMLTASGVGIGCLPDYIGAEHPDLVRILPHDSPPPVNAYLCYDESVKNSKKVSSFRDYIVQKVQYTTF